jgi:hypothetical protein
MLMMRMYGGFYSRTQRRRVHHWSVHNVSHCTCHGDAAVGTPRPRLLADASCMSAGDCRIHSIDLCRQTKRWCAEHSPKKTDLRHNAPYRQPSFHAWNSDGRRRKRAMLPSCRFMISVSMTSMNRALSVSDTDSAARIRM